MEKLQVPNPVYPPLCFLFSVVALCGGLLNAKQEHFGCLLAAVCLVYPFFGYGRVLLKCLAVFIPLSAAVAMLSWLAARDGTAAAQMAGRVLLLGLCAVPLISMPPICLTRCLTQARCPRVLTLGMLVAIRFVPVLMGEMKRILEAMKTRGVRLTLNPSVFYRAFLVPLIMRLIGISEILSLSIETRGFSLSESTASIYRPVRFTARDGVFLAVTAALAACMAVVLL
jgi:energy-coupling factor transport system permease protein